MTGSDGRISGRKKTHIKVICLAHLQATVPLCGPARVTIADDVLEGVTSLPLASVSSDVTLHCVRFTEVVPRTNQVNSLDRGVSPSIYRVSFLCKCRRRS